MNYALIMAGGSGTRLWPLSRRNRSKQSLQLVGERTMFQHAVDRLAPLFQPDHIYVVTREDQWELLASQAPELPLSNFITEPFGRGTAAAIGLAAIILQSKDPDATMAILTADHFITNTEKFRHALKAAYLMAATGHLVTLGVKPDSPAIGFGYIHKGHELETANGFPVFQVERFTEKPELEAAREMVKSGEYCLNSGMFIWRADRILQEFKIQMPALYAQLMQVGTAFQKPDYKAVLESVWKQVKEQTIDYGVMEHADDVVVLPVDIGWTDVGNWASLGKLLSPDKDGNTFIGPYKEIDTHNTLVFGGKRLIATIGVQDIVIVDSDDAILICAKQREQEVKGIVEQLKQNGENQWL